MDDLIWINSLQLTCEGGGGVKVKESNIVPGKAWTDFLTTFLCDLLLGSAKCDCLCM